MSELEEKEEALSFTSLRDFLLSKFHRVAFSHHHFCRLLQRLHLSDCLHSCCFLYESCISSMRNRDQTIRDSLGKRQKSLRKVCESSLSTTTPVQGLTIDLLGQSKRLTHIQKRSHIPRVFRAIPTGKKVNKKVCPSTSLLPFASRRRSKTASIVHLSFVD